LVVEGFRRTEGAEFPVCRTEYYTNRAFAAVGRLLPRHTGPIFPLIEDLFGLSIVGARQEIGSRLC
jgi:GntR family transcriptional regulator